MTFYMAKSRKCNIVAKSAGYSPTEPYLVNRRNEEDILFLIIEKREFIAPFGVDEYFALHI